MQLQLHRGRDQYILSMLQLQLGARDSLTEAIHCSGDKLCWSHAVVAVALENLAINVSGVVLMCFHIG